MVLFRKDSLSIDLYQDTLYLHPTIPTDEPGHDELLRGTVTLNLATSRRLKCLRIQLKGLCSILSDYRYESYPTLVKDLEIDLRGERLKAGEHCWNWSFIVPSTTATQERSVYGTVRHQVKAWCEGTGTYGTLAAFPRPVWFIANPSPAGELPNGLEVVVRNNSDEVGPITLQISSPHLTVASLCFLNISFLQPPDMEILSVAASVLQAFSIKYESGDEIHPPRQKKIIFYVDSTTPLAKSTSELLDREQIGRGTSLPASYESRHRRPKALVQIQKGEPWSYSRIVRILDDDHVRPTTLEGTTTAIRVKHQLVLEVRYRLAGSKEERTLECCTNVTIASCCCLQDSLLLPSYVRARPPATPISPFHRRCLCNRSTADLVTKEGLSLCGADLRPTQSAMPPPKEINANRLARQRSAGAARRVSREFAGAVGLGVGGSGLTRVGA